MHSKSFLTGLAGWVLVGIVAALPSGASLNETLSHAPTTKEESATFCEAVGHGDSPVPDWYWNRLSKSFKTRTDIFVGNRKLRFARFADDVCGLCPEFPMQPIHYQVGKVDKLASGRCKTFKLETEWNSFIFDYGSKISDCRLDVHAEPDCDGPVTHSYESNAEHHCQTIPHGGKSVHVECGKPHDRVEFLHWPVDEVMSCAATDLLEVDDVLDNDNVTQQPIPPTRVMLRNAQVADGAKHSASTILEADEHDDDNEDDDDFDLPDEDATDFLNLESTRRIKTVVHQQFDALPPNGTSFAYFQNRDCGSCGNSSETGTAMLLESGQCQTLPSNFTSFFFKIGDSIQVAHLQVFGQAACAGEATSESPSRVTCRALLTSTVALDEWDTSVCQLMEYDVIGRSVKAVFTTNSDAGMQ